MIKVLQVIGSLNYGGIEAVIMNYYRNIDKTKFQFDFITTIDGGRFESEIRELGGNIFCLPSKSRHPFKYMRQLKRIIKENRYDIVHSNTNSASAFLDLYPAKCAKCKVRIAHSHNTSCLIKWQHKIFKPLLPFVVTHRFACSVAAAKWLFGNNKNFILINNGIDFDKFSYNPQMRDEIRKLMCWQDCVMLGNVASFQERKNQQFLIELMPALLQKIPNAKLVLVGKGVTQEPLKKLCAELHLENNVEFLGARNDVERLLQGFDIFCFPSYFEGLAVAYIEAIASSLPVIISDGVPYVAIGDKITRLPLEQQQWLDAILRIMPDLNNRALITQEERQSSGYDIKELTKKLENYYEEVVSNSSDKKRQVYD